MASIPFQDIEYMSIQLYSFEGENFDITELVTEFSLNESIHYPFVYGKIGFIDNSGLMARVPMIGQEFISIVMKVTDYDVRMERLFFTGGFENAKPTGTGHSGIILNLIGIEQANDTNHTFSRYAPGINTDIIAQIYNEFFSRQVQIESPGDTIYNLVIPYTTPLGAINSLLMNTWAADNTPLFLYDTLYQKQAILKSYKRMIDDPYEFDITALVAANPDRLRGIGSKYIHARSGLSTNYEFPHAYDTYKLMANGGYKHTIHHADYSDKTIDCENLVYDYKADGPVLTGDYLTNRFHDEINDNTMIVRRYTNNNAYGTAGSDKNLFATDQIKRSACEQYMERMKTVTLHTQGSFHPLVIVGKTVRIDVQMNIPPVIGDRSKEDNIIDKMNSGNYVVSSIEHKYTRRNDSKYHVMYELIRDGINNNA